MGTPSTIRSHTETIDVTGLSPVGKKSASEVSLTVAACELVQLNLQYLLLPTVDDKLLAITGLRFSLLSRDAHLASADCLFSLFTIGFNDPQRWLPLLASSTGVPTQLRAHAPHFSAEGEVAAAVAFFAWHMARTDPAAAKVLLDLNGEVATALQRVSISQVLAAATVAASWLEPRWPTNRYFWPALLRNSCDPQSAELRAVKCLGRQLLAAESLEIGLRSHAGVSRPLRSRLAERSARSASGVNARRLPVVTY